MTRTTEEWWAAFTADPGTGWKPDSITSRSAADYITDRLPVHPYQAYCLLDQLTPFRHGMRYWYHRAELDALIAREAAQ